MANNTATATRTRSRRSTKPVVIEFKSKSDEALALLKGEHPEFVGQKIKISAVAKIMTARGKPMDYAFVYGVAKRNGLATTAANRRSVKSVLKNGNIVTVQTVEGPVVVNMETGEVTGGHRPAKVARSKNNPAADTASE